MKTAKPPDRVIRGLCRKALYCPLLDAVLLVELINTAAGIDQLLLAGVEGVALGADFNGDVLLGGTGLNDGPAGAADGGLLVIGMDARLHIKLLLSQRLS